MNRRTKQTLALVGAVTAITLMWPGPSSADTSLGGYSGVAQAEALRIQIYEPTIPIPATPQVDGGVAYTKSSTDTGPVSRGTASYLWPGDVIGDGFGQLVGNDKAQYAIQVNSRYPATAGAPGHNTAQLTDGNGMTTSSDGFNTKASVTGLGVAGPNTDLLGGIGDGLRNLPGMPHPSTSPKPLPNVPLPVSKTLAGLATVQNVTSNSSVAVGNKSVTSTAQTSMSQVKLLAGLITLDSVTVTATTVSDGKKATTTGSVLAGNVKIAGQDVGLTDKGVSVAGSNTKLPAIPDTVTKLLDQIGISVSYAPVTRSVQGAGGSLATTALVLSIDTQPLKTALNIGGIVGPLQDLLQKIPKIGSQLAPLLGLGPKIVFRIGDVSSSATASPAFNGGGIPGGGNTGGVGGAGGGTVPGSGSGGGGGLPVSGGGGVPVNNPQTPGTTQPSTQPAAFSFPKLGTIPRLLILGALALALVGGVLFRLLGGFIFGGARNCAYGLSTGVPDLRKG
jgi:hypothetical protein